MYVITLTRQEMFDQVVKGLKSQNWRKSMHGPSCTCRGHGGLKCVIGWLIPDDVASSCEGYGVHQLLDQGKLDIAVGDQGLYL